MKRTFNSTGRKALKQLDVAIRVIDASDGLGAPSFVFHLGDISALALPQSARVYVEPYVGSSSMRFDFGPLGAIRAPVDTTLGELDAYGSILFRVKIVDESADVGRILAAGNEIAALRADDAEGRKPLLPLRYTNLGEHLWKLELSPDTGPVLLVNNRVPGLGERMKGEALMQGMVLPEVLRQVLVAVYGADDEAEWVTDWKLFAERLVARTVEWDIDPEHDADDVHEEADQIVRAFVTQQKYASNAIAGLRALHV